MWMAFGSVLAIIGMVIVGGLIVGYLGKVVINIFDADSRLQDERDIKDNSTNYQASYEDTNKKDLSNEKRVESTKDAENDYNYAKDVDVAQAKHEKQQLQKEMQGEPIPDDFFDDFHDNDERFGGNSVKADTTSSSKAKDDDFDDMDLMSMIDEVSNDVLDSKKSQIKQKEDEKSKENASILDKYSIDNVFDDEEEPVQEAPQQEEKSSKENETLKEMQSIRDEILMALKELKTPSKPEEVKVEEPVVEEVVEEPKEENEEVVEEVQTNSASEEIAKLREELLETTARMEAKIQEVIEKKNEEMQSKIDEVVASKNKALEEQTNESNKAIASLKEQLNALMEELKANSKPAEKYEVAKFVQEQEENAIDEMEEPTAEPENVKEKVVETEEPQTVEVETKDDEGIVDLQDKDYQVNNYSYQEENNTSNETTTYSTITATIEQSAKAEIESEIDAKVRESLEASNKEIADLRKQLIELAGQMQTKEEPKEVVKTLHYSTEEQYLDRISVLEARLADAKKDLKLNNKELNPLEKVRKTLEKDKAKLRRKEAIAAKKKVALYGVNNFVDIDKEKAEKLAHELELLDGLRLSVNHCEEVMNANVDRYPILVHTNKILTENIANIESDLAELREELKELRDKNGNNGGDVIPTNSQDDTTNEGNGEQE